MASIGYRVTVADGLEFLKIEADGPTDQSSTAAEGTLNYLLPGDYTLTATATATGRTDERTVRGLDADENRFIGMHIA